MLSFTKTSMLAVTPVRYPDGGIYFSLPFSVTVPPGQCCTVDLMNVVEVPHGFCAALHLRAQFALQMDLFADVLWPGQPSTLTATFRNRCTDASLDLQAGVEYIYLVVTRAFLGGIVGAFDYLANPLPRPSSRQMEEETPGSAEPPPLLDSAPINTSTDWWTDDDDFGVLVSRLLQSIDRPVVDDDSS